MHDIDTLKHDKYIYDSAITNILPVLSFQSSV